MFDISFAEILIIAVVAVVVIGPERLPKTVRTLGHLFGRAQRYVSDIKSDIQREMEMEELRKVQQSVQEVSKDIEQSIQSTLHEAEKTAKRAEDSVREIGSELNSIADEKPALHADDGTVPTTVASEQEAPASVLAETDITRLENTATSVVPEVQPVVVPTSLQGEVELSIPGIGSVPGALPTSNKKPSNQ